MTTYVLAATFRSVAAIAFSCLLALAGADFTGTEPFELAGGAWLGAALAIAAVTAAFAYRTWRLIVGNLRDTIRSDGRDG